MCTFSNNNLCFFYFSADPDSVGGDTLTCGVCKKEFALADIVKFIQHKVLTCNKENYSKGNTDSKKTSAENGDSAEVSETTTTTALTTTTLSSSPTASAATAASTLTRRHSISTTTPVNEVKSLVTAAARARAAATDGVDNNNISSLSELVKTELESRRKVDCVDAESNTVNSGKALIFATAASASYGFIMIGIYTAP